MTSRIEHATVAQPRLGHSPSVRIPANVLELAEQVRSGKVTAEQANRRLGVKTRATRPPGSKPGTKASSNSLSLGEYDRRAKALRGARDRLRRFHATER